VILPGSAPFAAAEAPFAKGRVLPGRARRLEGGS
jgi:hypothetical protein